MSNSANEIVNGFDKKALRQAFGAFPTGVTVVSARDGRGRAHGMTANSFTSVSLDPAMLLICVNENAHIRAMIKRERRFGVSILGCNQKPVSQHFANQERLDNVRFAEFSAVPVIEHALAHFSCDLFDCHQCGDHSIVVGEIYNFRHYFGQPLVFHGGMYRQIEFEETPQVEFI